jgi:integrase
VLNDSEDEMALTERNGIWHWRKIVHGHAFARSTKTGDKKLAEQIAALWEAEAIKEVVLKGTKPVLLHSVIKAFLDARKGTCGHANAQVHLKHFLALPNTRMGDVTLPQLQSVVQKRRGAGASHNTLAVTVSYWNAVARFADAQKWGTGPRLSRIYPERTRIRSLTTEEEVALFAAIDPNAQYPGKCSQTDKARQDNSDLLLALIHTGCRYSEIARMTWAQVDLGAMRMRVHRRKGGVDNTLVMSTRLRAMLGRRKAEARDDWVFPTKRRHNNNHAWLRKSLARAGITEDAGRITLHTARHTFASRMLNGGMSLVEVQSLLGHKNIQSTMIYSHVESGAVAEKAARTLDRLPAAHVRIPAAITKLSIVR